MIETDSIFKINKDLFQIQNDGFLLTWDIPKDLPYFDGHFPGNPVLPAVAIIDLVQRVFSTLFPEENTKIKSIKTAKFTELIRPSDQLLLEFQIIPHRRSWSCKLFNQSQKLVSKVQIQFESELTSPINL
ncbi:hypothetical protein A9Q84_01245 [Halobacteriovorax marinus]|uniref:ApeI dehydratase-like domain-containing protein n=1 Tax=Halobacteriovorax marinus TaxID=97084 RepID=A0A1Y5FC34_9BACT|nr:hypothetical protein A9Q84_01245 [Halobacteriovorax marinus]